MYTQPALHSVFSTLMPPDMPCTLLSALISLFGEIQSDRTTRGILEKLFTCPQSPGEMFAQPYEVKISFVGGQCDSGAFERENTGESRRWGNLTVELGHCVMEREWLMWLHVLCAQRGETTKDRTCDHLLFNDFSIRNSRKKKTTCLSLYV